MSDIAGFAEETVKELDEKLKGVRIPRAKLGPCPVCGHEIVENRKGYSCWAREDPGCGFVIWKAKAGKQLPIVVARELIKTGYTARPVTGFRGRSGRSFRAHLAMSQTEDGQMAGGVQRGVGEGGGEGPRRSRPRLAARAPGRRRPPPSRRAAPPSTLAQTAQAGGRVGRVRQDGRAVPITLITGPANAGKAREVMGAVRGHLAHGEEPLLVVPTRADVEHYRRELAGEGAVMGARVERFEGLIGEVVRRAGVREPVLGGLARERVLAAIAGRSSLAGGGGGVAPGLVRALGSFLAELQVRRVTPGQLEPGACPVGRGGWGGSATGRARAGCSRSTRACCGDSGASTRSSARVRGAGRVAAEPALWGGTPVLFYGFDDFGGCRSTRSRRSAAVVGASVTVSLSYEPAGRRSQGARARSTALGRWRPSIAATAARRVLRPARHATPLSHLERSLFEPGAARVERRGAVRLLEGGGERAGAGAVAGEIAGAAGRAGWHPEEIAVVRADAGNGRGPARGGVSARRGFPMRCSDAGDSRTPRSVER